MADTFDATEDTTNEPFLLKKEEAKSFWLVDSLWLVLASAQTTGGALTVIEQLMPARSGPPAHVHPRLHEYFYLLDGEICYQIGSEVRTASPGHLVSIPAGTMHGFAVASETSRVLNLYTPGDSRSRSAGWRHRRPSSACPRRTSSRRPRTVATRPTSTCRRS